MIGVQTQALPLYGPIIHDYLNFNSIYNYAGITLSFFQEIKYKLNKLIRFHKKIEMKKSLSIITCIFNPKVTNILF